MSIKKRTVFQLHLKRNMLRIRCIYKNSKPCGIDNFKQFKTSFHFKFFYSSIYFTVFSQYNVTLLENVVIGATTTYWWERVRTQCVLQKCKCFQSTSFIIPDLGLLLLKYTFLVLMSLIQVASSMNNIWTYSALIFSISSIALFCKKCKNISYIFYV